MPTLLSAGLLFAVAASPALGRPAAIAANEGEIGQVFLTQNNGVCYALMPDHVVRRPGFDIVAGLPEQLGRGTKTSLAFPESGGVGMDLALASVTGALTRDCGPAWRDLPRDLGRVLQQNGVGELVRVQRNGVMERTAVRLRRVFYEHVEIEPTSDAPKGRIAKGTSGSVLMVNGIPAGLAVTTAGDDGARVLRMDAIVNRLDRFVNDRNPVDLAKVAPAGSSDLKAPPPPGHRFEITEWSALPAEPQYAAKNLEGGASALPYIAQAGSEPVTLQLAFTGSEAKVVRSIRIVSQADDAQSDEALQTTMPKAIEITVDSSSSGNRPRVLPGGDMSPAGLFETRIGGGTKARTVTLRLRSAWQTGLPVRIDRIVIE